MGAVLVHIDLDGDQPHPSSLAALSAGRAVASSWGATLYAALVVHDVRTRLSPDDTAQVRSSPRVQAVEAVQPLLGRAGADKILVAMTDAPLGPLWAMIGGAWQTVLDHLRPRLVLFGADAPSASELGPRTGARIGARLLTRARATGSADIELRDRDGGYVRASDGGAAVVMIGASHRATGGADDIDVVLLAAPGGGDPRIELAGSAPAEIAATLGAIVAIGEDLATDPEVAAGARELARLLGGHVVGSAPTVRAGSSEPGAVVERRSALAPELCIAIGAPALELAGATQVIRIGASGTPAHAVGQAGVAGTLDGPPGPTVAELARELARLRGKA